MFDIEFDFLTLRTIYMRIVNDIYRTFLIAIVHYIGATDAWYAIFPRIVMVLFLENERFLSVI